MAFKETIHFPLEMLLWKRCKYMKTKSYWHWAWPVLVLLLQALLLLPLPLLSGLSAFLCQDASCLLLAVGARWRLAGRCRRGGDSGERCSRISSRVHCRRGSQLFAWHSTWSCYYNRWANWRRWYQCRGHHNGRNVTWVYERGQETLLCLKPQ